MEAGKHPETAQAGAVWSAVFCLAVVLVGCEKEAPETQLPASGRPTGGAAQMPEVGELTIRGRVWQVAIVASEEGRTRGLSGVSRLAENEGMLFVFDEPSVQEFWMHGCHFPLDVAFIDADGLVVAIHTMPVEPPSTPLEEYPRYSSRTPVLYALEVRAGALADAGIQAGDPVQLPAGLRQR
jgi:hypothetical protein